MNDCLLVLSVVGTGFAFIEFGFIALAFIDKYININLFK